jgi:peptidoglycan/xylan/chitin deacetylase (PgdA/CDA1 family)
VSSLIPNKRAFLARTLKATGLLGLLDRVARRPCLLVLCYHRIGVTPTEFYDPLVSVTAESFEAQLRDLLARFRVLTLDECLVFARSSFPLREPCALVTFDDGYRDNYDIALPVLQSLGLTATFFITTGFVNNPRLPWWDHVAYVVKRTGVGCLRLDRPEPLDVDLGERTRTNALLRIIGAFLRADHDDPTLLAHLDERALMDVESEALARDLFLTWEQVREMAGAGMGIGAHTSTHRKLARLSEDEQRIELAESKRTLEQELGRDVAALAYPYGGPDTFDARTKRIASDLGYRLAISLVPSANRPGATDALDVHRIIVHSADSAALLRARTTLMCTFGSSPL